MKLFIFDSLQFVRNKNNCWIVNLERNDICLSSAILRFFIAMKAINQIAHTMKNTAISGTLFSIDI